VARDANRRGLNRGRVLYSRPGAPSDTAQSSECNYPVPMRDLVFVAFHFPPLQGSSGIQRTLSFARYLPEHGWRPHVLTVQERAYESVAASTVDLIPPGTSVHRCWALDSRRHLSLRGRHLDVLATPDRWLTWTPAGVLRGAALARSVAAAAICSTYPIATAHLVGFGISRLTGLPWVADLRDPMLQPDFPDGWLRRRSFGFIERLIMRHAHTVVVTTPGAAAYYRDRFPHTDAKRIVVVENGYDDFGLGNIPVPAPEASKALVLLHSGLIYRKERNPDRFFTALRRVLDDPEMPRVRLVLRAPGGELPLAAIAAQHGLAETIEILPPLPYREALAEMMAADGLLVLQSKECNYQIPAKTYEYLYARKPVIGITDPRGDTGQLLAGFGVEAIAALEDASAIEAMLRRCLPRLRNADFPCPSAEAVAPLSRRARTAEFARVLDQAAADSANRA
jgi:glycosyltransferase involved in cell wall biosynthesis